MRPSSAKPGVLAKLGLTAALLSQFALSVSGCAEDPGRNADVAAGMADAGGLDAGLGATPLDASVPDAALPPLPDVQVVVEDTAVPPMAHECESQPGSDKDGDGFPSERDCNDCDPNANAAAFDVPGNGRDEDCSGVADDEPAGCDPSPGPGDDAADAARALGICRLQRADGWGLVKAQWVYPDGTPTSLALFTCPGGMPPHPLSRSILSSFGAAFKPRDGASMVVISTGIAQPGVHEVPASAAPSRGTSPDGAEMCRVSRPPPGFPKNSPSCPGTIVSDLKEIVDAVGLEVIVKVPSNAYAISFDFNFMSAEFPRFVCSTKNDQFVSLLKSTHPLTPADENVSFDSSGNLLNVNNAFVEICKATTVQGRAFACSRGIEQLEGTGFVATETDDGMMITRGGSTGWLSTTAPVVPGETIRLRFAVWDAGDAIVDSTVLLDNLRWHTLEAMKPNPPPPRAPSTDRIILL